MAAAIAACVGGAGSASAQTVEYRIVERTGRTMVTGTADAQLNFAVQARVRNAGPITGLGQFGFDIRLMGEPETSGTFAREIISNGDYTYATTIGVSSVVGRGGLASQFTMLAHLSTNFNGLFNVSGGSFTNSPDNEIGVIGGGVEIGETAGVDQDGDGWPDGLDPNALYFSFDPATASTYFGASGNWSDIYRFRYTVTDFTPRTIVLRVQNPSANVFDQLEVTNNWFPHNPVTAGVFPADLAIGVGGQAPVGVCCDVATGACSVYVAGACAGGYMSATSCAPNPCMVPGSCCLGTGACSISPQNTCGAGNAWTAGGSCLPNPCPPPGKCCSPQHSCFVRIQSACQGPWTINQTCTPNDCPTDLGRCCDSTGYCAYTTQTACTATFASNSTCTTTCPPTGACCQTNGTCLMQVAGCTGWVAGSVCLPNPCPQPGQCCAVNGSCSLKLLSLCTTGPWSAGTTCTPNPCPPVGRCCSATGGCTLVIPTACTGVFSTSTVCAPNPCPQPGRCCSSTGVCTLLLQSACTDVFSVGTCTTGVCAQLGGCCNGHVCTTTIASGCTATGFSFKGAGSACGTAANPIACCYANFNHVDGVTVQDLMDYLNAWFAGNIAADTDGNGTLSVSDLTQFVNVWTAGC
jgi:hypothetical protein